MLLQEWQGFTHLDPIEGDVPAAPFDSRLLLIVSHARTELEGRTHDEVKEMADYIASEFKTKKIDGPGHMLAFFSPPAEHPQYESPQYAATMALMLVNEALRLDGNAAAVAAIDATEAATWVFLQRLPQHFGAALKNARSEVAREAVKERHRRTKELKDVAIGLAVEHKKKLHEQNLQPSAYELADKICAKVERHGRDILNVKLSADRSRKTIHEWLIQAERDGLL